MVDFYNIAFLVLINLIVALSAYYLLRLFYIRLSYSDYILTWFLLYLILIVGVELYLGIFKRLYISNVVLLQFVIFLTVFFISRAKKPIVIDKPDFSFVFNNKILLFSLCVFLSFFFIKLVLNLINPVLGVDSLIYHLTFPVAWLKSGNLHNPMLICGRDVFPAATNQAPYYPINAELFFFWLIFPLKNAFLADIAEAPFYFASGLAVYSILRKFNVNKTTCLFMALLLLLIPNCLKQIKFGSYVDVICMAIFLMSFNFILIWERAFNLKNAFFLGLSLGLFIGIKALNIFWSIALIPYFVYVIFSHLRQVKAANILLRLALIITGLFLFGSYSYIRSYILTGNIFYPIKFTLFGRELMPGYIDRLSFANLTYPLKEFSLRKLFFGEGLGLQLLGFILPASFIPLIALPFVAKLKGRIWKYLFLFIIPALMFLTYFFYIRAYWSRYLFPYLGIGLIISAIFLDNFSWGKKYITIIGFIAVIASMSELAHRWELIISILLSMGVFLAINSKVVSFKRLKKTTAISLCALVLLFLGFLNHKYGDQEYVRYVKIYQDKDAALAWKWMNDNTSGGNNIAYTGRAEYYPLFGSSYKNNVSYVSVNDKPSMPHYYPDGLYRNKQDFSAWRNNLLREKIGYLFIYLPSDSCDFPIESKWADGHPNEFKLVFENQKSRIYACNFN